MAVVRKRTVEIVDCEQNSDEWLAARVGIITASNFHKVMAGGEGLVRSRYMRDLAGEILTGRPAETFNGPAMRRGHEMEDEAREHYARTRFTKLQRIGFARNAGLLRYGVVVGASPDSLIGDDGGLEIKTMIPALMIERLEKPVALPSEHRAQVFGNMWVLEREWWDLKIYYPGMPDYTVRVKRDETYIKDLSNEVQRFSYELSQMVKRLKTMRGDV